MARPRTNKTKNSPAPAAAPARDSKTNDSGDTVFVALNRASGLTFVMPDGRRVEIQGNAASLRGQGKGKLPVGAFGLTPVKADDWEYIKKAYGSLVLFKSGLLFAAERKDYALNEADEKSELRHGLEPVAPEDMKTSPAAAAE
jgi:hypothetical protein